MENQLDSNTNSLAIRCREPRKDSMMTIWITAAKQTLMKARNSSYESAGSNQKILPPAGLAKISIGFTQQPSNPCQDKVPCSLIKHLFCRGASSKDYCGLLYLLLARSVR